MKSYIALYYSTGIHPLLGGVMGSRSSRWGSREDAESFLAVTLENNRNSGRDCNGEVIESNNYPEIFRHCPGNPPQAINGKCFGCGKVLTITDAKEYKQ